MTTLNLTFGIELEFLCIRPDGDFKEQLTASGEKGTAGPAIYHGLLKNGIPATGWEDLDGPINDGNEHPSHSRWRVEAEDLELSKQEECHLPEGWVAEAVELSSRKYHFFSDDWRREIAKVLEVLREVETTHGCRFIANQSTGFHVHVGNDKQHIPLRTAKNVFQMATAFERCFDEIHTVPRVLAPESITFTHHCYPPSFWHANCVWHTHRENKDRLANVEDYTTREPKDLLVYDRLANVEGYKTFEDLGSLFEVRVPEFPGHTTTGHNSAYNFDNLYPDPLIDRRVEDLTGTIEFRQHTGTLDYLEIVAWVLLMCQLVQYSNDASPAEFLDLLARSTDLSIQLLDLIAAMGGSEDVLDHYLSNPSVIGVLGDEIAEGPGDQHGMRLTTELLIAHNDNEADDRSGQIAVQEAIKRKFINGIYGLDHRSQSAHITPGAVAAELNKALATLKMAGVDIETQEGLSKARSQVLRGLADSYRKAVVGPLV